MANGSIDQRILDIVEGLTGRARKVCDYIIENGYITTEVIEQELKYGHGPRAVRDVRESGIPIVTKQSKDSSGKRCARYEFGDPSQIIQGRHQGRTQFPKKFKETLYENQQGKCAITGVELDIRYLQVDHKIPYQIQGDGDTMNLVEDDYMLITGECQRQKSWSCEQCENFKSLLDADICRKCYWASPDNYEHTECRDLYKLYLVYENDEAVEIRDKLNGMDAQSMKKYILDKLRNQ